MNFSFYRTVLSLLLSSLIVCFSPDLPAFQYADAYEVSFSIDRGATYRIAGEVARMPNPDAPKLPNRIFTLRFSVNPQKKTLFEEDFMEEVPEPGSIENKGRADDSVEFRDEAQLEPEGPGPLEIRGKGTPLEFEAGHDPLELLEDEEYGPGLRPRPRPDGRPGSERSSRRFSSDILQQVVSSFSRWCTEQPTATDGHPVRSLEVICDRTDRSVIEITGHRKTVHVSHLIVKLLDKKAPEALSRLTHHFRFSSMQKFRWEEEMRDIPREKAYPTREEWEGRNSQLPEGQKEPFNEKMAGMPFIGLREWLVVEKQLPALEPERSGDGTLLEDEFGRIKYKPQVHPDFVSPNLESPDLESAPAPTGDEPNLVYKETLSKRLGFDQEIVKGVQDILRLDLPVVLFLTTTDEESVTHPRYLVLPFPNILIRSQADKIEAEENGNPLFQMPIIKVTKVAPLATTSNVTVSGSFLDRLCLRRNADTQSEPGESDSRQTVCQGMIIGDQNVSQIDDDVSITYTLSEDKQYWSHITFEFTGTDTHAFIEFKATRHKKKENTKSRQRPFWLRSQGGAYQYLNIDFFNIIPSSSRL